MEQIKTKKLNWSILSEQRAELMGFSILLIMFFHFCENFSLLIPGWKSMTFDGTLPYLIWRFINIVAKYGMCGVEMFLVLSGMGLFFSFHKNNDLFHFYKKRFLAIAIPYFMIAAPYLVWQNFIWDGMPRGGVRWFFSDLFLLTTFESDNRQGWYVALILFCYALFPLFYQIVSKFKTIGFVIFEALMIGGLYVLERSQNELFTHFEVALCRVPTFFLGVYIGFLVYNKKRMCALPIVLLVGYVLFLKLFEYQKENGMFFATSRRLYKACIMLFLFVCVALIFHLIKMGIMRKVCLYVAPMTLELYLSHVEVRRMFTRLFRVEWTKSMVILAFAGIVGVAFLVSPLVNRGSTRLLKKMGV